MKENRSPLKPDWLSRFFENEQQAQDAIDEALEKDPDLSKDQLYNLLAHRRGQPTTHVSSKQHPQWEGKRRRS